jgi:pyruvate/2-oxoglutarate dehydrogenase complex dihydrolipoamide dehydrogenase (E3) component
MLNLDAFPTNAAIHYKHANLDELLQSVRGTEDQIVLVGGGEAGADLGVALANRGAKVLIVESGSDENKEEGRNVDPSRRLSPVTQERLSRVADRIEFRSSTKCTGARREGGSVTVTFEAADQAITTVTTRAKAVLCTGFDPSYNPVLKELLPWKNDSPEVTPTHDESKTTRNFFLAGPALSHTLSCAPGDGNEEAVVEDEVGNNGEVDDETQKIIFCFVYKYRARFAVVASEIIKRFVEAHHAAISNNLDVSFRNYPMVSAEELDEVLVKCKRMQSYYRSKGMMLTDLSCAQLACGMTADDRPVYDYDPCTGCETDCVTC